MTKEEIAERLLTVVAKSNDKHSHTNAILIEILFQLEKFNTTMENIQGILRGGKVK